MRNQVIQPPKLRPPRPHSSRLCMLSPRRQRLATKPSALTATKRTPKTTSSVTFTPPTSAPRLEVDDEGAGHAQDDDDELVPVEERDADQARAVVVVQRRDEGDEQRDHQQP